MNPASAIMAKARGVFYGWWVVLAGTLLYGVGIGSIFYGFNTFFNPMINEFHWSRAATSGAFSLSRLEGGFSGPVVGWLIDRFGVRKLAALGVTVAGCGFIALILVNRNVWSLYLIFGLLISVGYDSGFSRPCMAAAAKWFISKRSRAMTLITIGGGIGGAIIVPMLGKLITAYGWRTAAVITGVTVMVLGLPMAYFMRNTPEEMGLEPDGEKAFFDESGKRVSVPRSEANFTVRQALVTGTYWNFAIAMLLRAGILSSMVIHQIPHLVDLGIGYQVATKILGSMILISIPGRFVFGWLGDKIDKRKLLFIVCMLQATGIFIFIHASSILMLYLFVTVFGLSYGGAIPLVQGLTADLFGRKIFATLSGITVSLTMISTVSAPVLLGRLYDVTKSYSIGFYVLFIFISLSGLCFYLIRLPKQASAVRQ